MKFRSTWILVCILAAVAAYFFLFEQRGRETEPPDAPDARHVLPYGRDDVVRIELINPAGERIVIERSGEEWTIVHPLRTRGSQPTIDAVLMQVVPGLKLETVRDVPDLGDFGLDDPFATLILTARGRTHPDTICVGDKTPTSTRCYVRLGASRDVYITRELTHNVMNKNLYHLRDKNFFPPGAHDIDRLTIRNGSSRIALIKRDGSWRFEESGLRADAPVVEGYLNALTAAIVYEFFPEGTSGNARFGLKNPRRKLIVGAGKNTFTISFGRTEGGKVYTARSGMDEAVFLKEELLRIFNADRTMLRAKNITFTAVDAVKRIRIESNGTVVDVTETGTGWRFTGPDSAAAPQNVVAHLVTTLRGIRFEEVFDASLAPPEVGDGASSISITLADQTGRTIDVILLALADAGYEFGSSTSTMTFGRLPSGTTERIERIINRLRG